VAELRFEATSPGVAPAKTAPVLFSLLCLLPGESPTSSFAIEPCEHVVCDSTTAGPRFVPPESLIARIRQLSGLTWEQLAKLCGTSRRTLHLWASGRRMQAANEERLLRILGILERIDAGSSDQNRRRLLEVQDGNGVRIFDLLLQGRFDEASRALGLLTEPGTVAPVVRSRPLPVERRLPPPVDLLDAEQDAVHVERGHHPKPRLRRLRRGK